MTKYALLLNRGVIQVYSSYFISKSLFLFVFISCFLIKSAAQHTITTSEVGLNSFIRHHIHQYQAALGKTTNLYNGAEYIRPFPLIKGSPFLEVSELQNGAVYFDGIFYPDVMINFDIVNQEVITTGYQNISITLVPQKIGYFYLSNRLFIPAPLDSATNKKTINGFCEVLYNNELLVLAHYQKTPKRSSDPASQMAFTTYTTFFIAKGNSVSKITNEKALLAFLGDQKEQLRKFMRSNNLKFKKAPAETLVKTANYYMQLKK